jgi:hypothetical protein
MDKVLKFFTSPMGKLLIALIVLSVVSYIGWVQWVKAQERKKYNGYTKSEVEDTVISNLIQEKINNIPIENEKDTSDADFKEWHRNMVAYYDSEFGGTTLSSWHVNRELSTLGISEEAKKDFDYLVGSKHIMSSSFKG